MILVTGATGFLGKRVCTVLDSMGEKYTKTSLSLGTDLRDLKSTFELFNNVKPDYVINCAAYVGGIQFGYKHPAEIVFNNMQIILNIVEACNKFNVKRLVNPISNCVYPRKATYFVESEIWDGPLDDSVLFYGMSRKMSYITALAYNKQYGLDSINIVLSNMYGPDDHFEEERSHALGALIMKFSEAKRLNLNEVTVWGTGEPVREWLHVNDGATALIKALNCRKTNEIINVGTGTGISISDLSEIIKKVVKYEGKIVYDKTKPDGAPYKTVDGSKGRNLLDWSPEIDLFEGIVDTVRWYKIHKEGIKK